MFLSTDIYIFTRQMRQIQKQIHVCSEMDLRKKYSEKKDWKNVCDLEVMLFHNSQNKL